MSKGSQDKTMCIAVHDHSVIQVAVGTALTTLEIMKAILQEV